MMKGMMKGSVKIRLAAAYYRNDLPTGLGVGLNFEPGDDRGAALLVWAQAMMAVFDRAGPERAFAWLREQAPRARGETLTRQAIEVAIATVHWLEQRGHLASDEYNGMIWMGTSGAGLFCLRNDELSEARMRELRAALPSDVQILTYDPFTN